VGTTVLVSANFATFRADTSTLSGLEHAVRAVSADQTDQPEVMMDPFDLADNAPRKPERRSREERRREITRIAAQMFAENGYDATGINELIQAVGVGKGAFYYHMGSKEELLYSVSVEHVESMVAVGQALVERSDLSAEEKFRALSRELMRAIARNLPELTVFFCEIRALTRGSRAHELIELRDQFEAVWQRIIQEGIEQGIFKDLSPVTIKCILGMHNYSYIWIRPEGPLTPEQISDTMCEIILKGLMVAPG
jgi:AcrR family transcriptional regulator